MPSSLNSQPTNAPAQVSPWRARTWAALIGLLSLTTLLIHGYHPFAEDGGLYVAGVEYTLDPTLFPHDTAFVTAHLHYSIFAPTLAACVHITHLPLNWILFLAELFTLALTFFAAHQLLRRCIASQPAQLAGLALLSTWATIPVAGTSLMLMDPYLTARSFSTPLTLLAIAFALDPWRTANLRVPHSSQSHSDGWGSKISLPLCLISLIAAVLFHPLMAAYGAAFVLTLRLQRLDHPRRALTLLTLAALVIVAVIQAFAPAEPPTVVAAAISRYYWFLSQWQWYELLGLAGPLAVLYALLRTQRARLTPAAAALLQSCLYLALLAALICLLFAHESYSTHLVARLQPLRIYLTIYAIMALLLGATITQSLLTTNRPVLCALPVALLLAFAAIFFAVQRATFTASPHIELPGREARNTNPWVQAFLWVRANTPHDALFALDAKYVNEDGEDAQTFRAWSLRSALPDFSKDGGEAAITPALAATWQKAATTQKGLSTNTDTQRDTRILPLGATWMIVHANAITQHPCLYTNSKVKVCPLGP